MRLVLVALVVGVVLVAVGLALSPVSWLAWVWLGVASIVAGLFGEVPEP